jgi:hypothetical protein
MRKRMVGLSVICFDVFVRFSCNKNEVAQAEWKRQNQSYENGATSRNT